MLIKIQNISESSCSLACLTGLTGLFSPGTGCFSSRTQLHILTKIFQINSIFLNYFDSSISSQLFLVKWQDRETEVPSIACVGGVGQLKRVIIFPRLLAHAYWLKKNDLLSMRVSDWLKELTASDIYFRPVTLGQLYLGYH